MPTPIVVESFGGGVEVVAPLAPPGLTVAALPIVAQATPAPTLVDGRPT